MCRNTTERFSATRYSVTRFFIVYFMEEKRSREDATGQRERNMIWRTACVLRVELLIEGASWFGAGEAGSRTGAERSDAARAKATLGAKVNGTRSVRACRSVFPKDRGSKKTARLLL